MPDFRPPAGFPTEKDEEERVPRTKRESGLDRILELRASLDARTKWLQRGSVAAVSLALGVGTLQGWPLLSALAFPAGALFWWRHAEVARVWDRVNRFYDAVFEGTVPPPEIGEELEAANRMGGDDIALRAALLGTPGAGVHVMMLTVALLVILLV